MADVSDVSRIVIDASVILAWLLPLETLQEKANMLIRLYEQAATDFLCPIITRYEVLNGLRSAVLSKRIRTEQLDEAYRRYDALAIPTDDVFVPNNETLHLAITHDLSLYDASYIHLAFLQGFRLVTADKKIVNKLKDSSIVKVVYLGDLA